MSFVDAVGAAVGVGLGTLKKLDKQLETLKRFSSAFFVGPKTPFHFIVVLYD